MTEVREARKAYIQAQRDSKALLAHARIRLGKAIREARDEETPQEEIADALELTRERLRLFQREYEKALAEGLTPSPYELQLAERIVGYLIGDDPDRMMGFAQTIAETSMAGGSSVVGKFYPNGDA